jgi:hypothetical protein
VVDEHLIAGAEMVAEIKAFAALPARTREQQELIDLLEVVEHGPTLGFDTAPVIQELAKKFKQWKYEREKPGSLERAQLAHWPFIDREAGRTAPDTHGPVEPGNKGTPAASPGGVPEESPGSNSLT